MSKICCIGDANVSPKSSSCPMVLRSACTHGHSHESSTVKEYSFNTSTPEKRKHTSSVTKKVSHNGSLHLESLESSLKELALKSDEKSLLAGSFCSNFELSESLEYTSEMSRSQRFTRSSVASTRCLSDDDEDDISVHRIVRPLSVTNSVSSFTPSRRKVISEKETVIQNTSNNHAYHSENLYSRYAGNSDGDSLSNISESSHPSLCTIQNSLFHRFRWFLWRCTYLKIIKVVNFDVWLLSRLHNYGKYRVIFFLLLPLLLLFLWHILPHHSSQSIEIASKTLNSVNSSVLYISSAFSSLLSSISYFVLKCPQFIYASWLVKTEESATSITERGYGIIEPPIHHKKEETKTLHLSGEETKTLHLSKEETKTLHLSKEETKTLHQNKEEINKLQDEIKSLKEILKNNMEETEVKKIENSKLHSEIKNLQLEYQMENSQLHNEIKNLQLGFQIENSKLHNEIKNLQLEFQSLTRTVGDFEANVKKGKSEIKEDFIILTKEKLHTIEEKLTILEGIKKCCVKQWNEENLILAFKKVIDADSDPSSKYYFFNEWLNSKFSELATALKKETTKSDNEMNYDNVIKVIEKTVFKYVDSIKRNLSELNKSSYSSINMDLFSEDKVKQIVKEAIMLYDADKIGKVDYALESGGGSVLGTRCSETYVEKYGKLSIFGVPLWTDSNSPRTAIQPDVQPGRCWAFKGTQGFLVIELSATIHPTEFTMEHIPVSLSPSGSIDSAPKNFSVWGLDSEKDSKGNLLGEYVYDVNGEPLQYFSVQKPSEKPYTYVELQIHSNHGNMEYTCLYRFRVHGKRVR